MSDAPDTQEAVDTAAIFRGLNEEQVRAVEAAEGPVCILAGAGSGKTTTITRRLANQVVSGAFSPDALLAVTFTRKAAEEMRSKLAALGAPGIKAMTFHAAARSQLAAFHPEMLGNVLSSKSEILYRIARTLPMPYKFTPLIDLASEIEWAKNQRIGPDRYLNALHGHIPPIPKDQMQRIYASYEKQKAERGLVDFEDILERTIDMFKNDESALTALRSKIHAVTIDEYQDVNLLQQTLLEMWLGDRSEVCAVGDDYQAIYSFTGASPRYLLGLPDRFPDAQVIRLEVNYRSSPDVVTVANRLVEHLGGSKKVLIPIRPASEPARLKGFLSPERELAFIIERINEIRERGVPLEEMAILYRTNASSERYEDALSAADIPYQVRDGAFLERPAAMRMLPQLKKLRSTKVAKETERLARAEGLSHETLERAGVQEQTRQKDLAQLVALAEEFDDGTRTTRDFVADLDRRFGVDEGGRGVNLLTLHSAKGLEFDTVFIPSLEEGELPYKRASQEVIPEERRLLYVGITRAKNHLHITWTMKKPSRFVAEVKPIDTRGALRQEPLDKGAMAEEGAEIDIAGGMSGTIVSIEPDGVLVKLEGGGAELFIRFGERVTIGEASGPLRAPA